MVKSLRIWLANAARAERYFKLTRLSRMACRNNLKAASLLFEGNSLFQ
jgi:hypothetical protein